MKKLLLILLFAPAVFADSIGGGLFNVSASKAKEALFANLSAPVEGNFRYCPDCQPTSPCSGGGTGAFAFRVDTTWHCGTGASGTGDVVGPASAPDNAIPRFNLTTGKLIQDSTVLIDDDGDVVLSAGRFLSFGAGENGMGYVDGAGPKFTDNTTATELRFNVQSLTLPRTATWPNSSGTVAYTTSNVATATALAANPTDCSANQFAHTIAASGNLTCSTVGSVTNLAVSTGVTNANGMQHVRTSGCTTAASANSTCDTAITWPVAFADTNYTVAATLDTPTGGLVFVLSTKNKATTGIDVTLITLTAVASSGIVDIIAMHD